MAAKKTIPKSKKTVSKSKTARSSVVTPLSLKEAKPSSNFTAKYLTKNTIIALFLAILAGLLFLKGFIVAAIVDGMIISRYSVISELEKQGGKSALEGLITKNIIEKEARGKNVVVTQADVDAEISDIKTYIEGQGMTLDQALEMQGQTMADLEHNIRIQIMVNKIFDSEISVSDEDVQKYYDSNKDAYEGSSFDQVKDQIRDQLKQQQVTQKYQEWITDKRASAKIKYFVNY